MKKFLLFSLYAFFVFFVLARTFEFHASTSRAHPIQLAEENTDSKALWEYLMLRDPVTNEIPHGIHTRELNFVRRIAFEEPAQKQTSTIHTMGWNFAGPINAGGRTRAIGIDISNEANILIATAQGGVFRSTDSGFFWSRTTAPGELKNMSSLVQDHRTGKSRIWYAGTGELVSTTWRRTTDALDPNWHFPNVGNGIYKSTDDGMTWNVLQSTVDATPVTLDSAFDGVWDIAIDNSRSDSDIVYAAGYGAIMRSNNGGITWTHALGDHTTISIATDVQVTSSGVVYAVLSSQSANGKIPSTAGVWRSVNGINWTKITPSFWPQTAGRMKIAIAPSNDSIVYIGGLLVPSNNTPGFYKYRYYSGNGSGAGGEWDDRSQNITPPSSLHDGAGVNSYGGYCISLSVYPTDTNLVFFGGTNLYRSWDGFQSSNEWIGGYNPADGGYGEQLNDHPDHHDLQFLPSDPDIAYNAGDGGMYMTYNVEGYDDPTYPVTWQNTNFKDAASIAYVVALDHATPGDSTLLAGLQDQGSWLTADTTFWYQYDGGDGCFCAIADGKSAYYMSSENGYLDQFLSSTNSFPDSVVPNIRPGFGNPQFLSPFQLDPSDNNRMYYSAGNSVWLDTDLSTNPSFNWIDIADDTSNSFISALGVSTVPVERLYYGTSDGHLYRLDNANNSSSPPVNITSAIFPKNGFISCVAIDPNNADSIVVTFSNYHVISIFASNDGGSTWHNASGNLEESPDGSGDGPSVRWVTIVHQGGQTLYLCGTSVGLFSTTDITGPNVQWSQEATESIGYAIVENIDARQSDGFVAVATQGSGIYSTHVVASTNNISQVNNSVPSIQVWPNPTHALTHVSISLPNNERAELSLLDPAGRSMVTLVSGSCPEGTSSKVFDASTFPSGSYFLQLRTDEAIETRRIVIQH